MAKHEAKSVVWIIFTRLVGLLLFLLLLYFLDYLKAYIDSSIYRQSVDFLKENIVLIVSMAVIYAAGEVFGSLMFPLDLPAPIIDAVASVFLVKFVFRILSFLGEITGESVFNVFSSFEAIVYPTVFILVLVFGYFSIFGRLFSGRKKRHKED
jgi:hypothetical protein